MDGEELLMVGGEGHHVGASEATPERYEALVEFAQRHWDVTSIDSRWSSQDFVPDDGVPFIGPLTPLSDDVLIVTGLKKWGITGGTVAAEILRDRIVGRDNEAASFFSSTRLNPLGAAPKFVMENSKVGLHFLGDRIRERGTRPIEDLAAGEGDIVSGPSGKVAGYRTEDGALRAVSTRCTHLGCQVRWNGAEQSWDCPCHGSRFGTGGEVLNGPATEPLEPRETIDGEPGDQAGAPAPA
jgi:nitrite reductase/ring-hydroxylating ferredoxin subunit